MTTNGVTPIPRSAAPTKKAIACLTLAVLLPLALDGCVSVGLSRSILESGRSGHGALELAVYERVSDRDARDPVPYPVFSELLAVDTATGNTSMVARSMRSSWTLAELPPGTYVLRVPRRLNDAGDIEPLSGPAETRLLIRPGEKTTANVVLKKVPVGWIVLAAITVVLLVILSIELAKEGKLPSPRDLPRPHFGGIVVFAMPRDGARNQAAPVPAVADVFPARGSVVAARRVTASFLITTPLAKDGLEKDAVLALGTKSGEISGTVSYRPEDQLIRFGPDRDFAPDEDVTVTLDLQKVRSIDGRSGDEKVSTRFSIR